MARGTEDVFAVLFHDLAERPGQLLTLGQRGYVRRRRRGRRTEDLLEHPLAALDRRGSRRVRGQCQDAGLRQDAAAVGRQLDPTELLARHTLNAVKLRQPPVHEAEVGVDEVENAAILAEDRLEEQLRLADHGRTQLVVEPGEFLGIGCT